MTQHDSEEPSGADLSGADLKGAARSGDEPSLSEQRTPGAAELAAAYAARAGLSRHDDGRIDILRSAGGIRGVVESVLPGIVFLVVFTIGQELLPAILWSLGIAAVLVVARVIGRTPLTQALVGVAGVGVSAALALFTGKAENFYVSGFFTNAGYSLALILSIIFKWPLIGVLFGFLRNEGLHWRADPRRMRQYVIGTWIMAAVLLLRLSVQLPLYLMGEPALVALGTTRLLMGVPLYALGLWLAWLVTMPMKAETSAADGSA